MDCSFPFACSVGEWFPHLCLLPTKHTHSGRYSDQYILEFYKQKLKSMPCQNQGFVLDGFPKTYEQAKQLFARESATPFQSYAVKLHPC